MIGNQRLVLARRPTTAAIRAEDFDLVEGTLPEPREGQFLVRVCWLGFDPAQRGWLQDTVASYVPLVQVGETMRGSAVGQVIASRHDDFPEGSMVCGLYGWQRFALDDGSRLTWRIDPDLPPRAALGTLGTPGLTAYFGMTERGRVASGDVVLVSGAAGATGSTAGQIARLHGARVIGVAGGPRKCHWLVEHGGFDAAIDYRSEDIAARLESLAPDGVDLFYDNVGGAVLDGGLAHLAVGARVVLCGAISTRYAGDGVEPPGVRNMAEAILRRARLEGFVVIDYEPRFPEARRRLTRWVRSGGLRIAEDLRHGSLTDAPQTLQRLFDGANIGKQLLQIATPT